MEEGWLALAIEQDWLDGEIHPTGKRVAAEGKLTLEF
jgi:hypothetical protein